MSCSKLQPYVIKINASKDSAQCILLHSYQITRRHIPEYLGPNLSDYQQISSRVKLVGVKINSFLY